MSVEENKDIARFILQAFPDAQVTVDELIAEGDKVALERRSSSQ